jgi:hypothetical protein
MESWSTGYISEIGANPPATSSCGFSQRRCPQVLDLLGERPDDFSKTDSLGSRNPFQGQTVIVDAKKCQQFTSHFDDPYSLLITIQVMAVTNVSATYKYPVSTQLKRLQDEIGINPARTHHADNTDVGRILKAAYSSQISGGIGTPVATKRYDFWFVFSTHVIFSFIRIYPPRAASTMVSTCMSVKWRIAAAPVGQATAQAPQPLHIASLT